jgi:hypothetical protein
MCIRLTRGCGNFGRCNSRLGGLTVMEMAEMKDAAHDERTERGQETRWRRKKNHA